MEINSLIEKEFRLKEDQKKALVRANLSTIKDLLYYFPSRYNNISEVKKIKDLKVGDETNIYGKIVSTKITKAYRKKIPIAEAMIEDETGKIKAVWFNQVYIVKMFKIGEFIKLAGKITDGSSGTYIANPEVEKTKDMPIDIGDSLFSKKQQRNFTYAIYPERRGITTRWMYHTMQKILSSGLLDELKDPIPQEILEKYHLPKLKTALIWIHSPKKDTDSLSARKRFSFEEIFFIQLNRQKARKEYKKNLSYKIDTPKKDIEEFKNKFPFTPTRAQDKATEQILLDFKKDEPMSRLLEGDVGSGKTFVAATAAYSAISTRPNGQDFGNLQVAYMAPTEILAKQHFESFIDYFKHSPINIGLITGSGCKKFPSKTNPNEATNISRAQLLKWVENGEIPILIGTHSLIQKTVKFQDLAFVIIDEQHRFGTAQRSKLVRKDNIAPHLLSMTATPIPRTLALTIYGDLDLTLIDEMPKGRKRIITEIVSPDKRTETYEKIKTELKEGRQVFVICPRIEEPDPDKANALRVKSVQAEAKRLKEKEFSGYEIDILHSKMKPNEKENIMEDFTNGDTDILVSTSVVEVGVNVPNATTIIIEGAERFGLAQLHQLRGRVGRSDIQSYCYLLPEQLSASSEARLRAMEQTTNGFELAQRDLELRGPGNVFGKDSVMTCTNATYSY